MPVTHTHIHNRRYMVIYHSALKYSAKIILMNIVIISVSYRPNVFLCFCVLIPLIIKPDFHIRNNKLNNCLDKKCSISSNIKKVSKCSSIQGSSWSSYSTQKEIIRRSIKNENYSSQSISNILSQFILNVQFL